jgi:hypothetical protein
MRLDSEIISIHIGKRADDTPHARDDLTALLRARGGFETALNGRGPHRCAESYAIQRHCPEVIMNEDGQGDRSGGA